MMRNLPHTLICAVALAAVLMGCGGSDDESADGEARDAEQQTPAEEPETKPFISLGEIDESTAGSNEPDNPPDRSASGSAMRAADALERFLMARAERDLDAIRAVTLDHPDLGALIEEVGPVAYDREAEVSRMQGMLQRVDIVALQVGDAIEVPGQGRMTVDASMVGDDRVVLSIGGAGMPFPMRRVDGAWRVDPELAIASIRHFQQSSSPGVQD